MSEVRIIRTDRQTDRQTNLKQICFGIQISTPSDVSDACVSVLEITCAYAKENIYICSWVKRF